MFGVAQLTLKKIKEPAFMIIFVLALVAGFMLTESGQLTEANATETGGLISQLMASRRGYPILNSSIAAIIFTLIMALFTGATDIPRDIDSRMIMLILSKPVRKVDYLLGKYFGLLALCLVIFVATEATVFGGYLISTGKMFQIGLMIKQFYLLLALFPLLAMVVMISCFVADISAMILGVIYVMFSASMSTVPLFIAMLPKSITGGVESYLFVIYYFFPNYLYYFQTFSTVGLIPFALFLYSLSLTVIFLTIGALRLNTRDLI